MSKKTETILAWIANGLSIIYLLLTCLSLTVMKSGHNQQQYRDLMKQMYGNDQNVTSDILIVSMIFSIGFLAFSTILGIFGALTIKGRKNLAGGLLVAAAVTGLITMNLIAMILWIIAAIMLFSKRKTNIIINILIKLMIIINLKMITVKILNHMIKNGIQIKN